jgi:hypothetical protein
MKKTPLMEASLYLIALRLLDSKRLKSTSIDDYLSDKNRKHEFFLVYSSLMGSALFTPRFNSY